MEVLHTIHPLEHHDFFETDEDQLITNFLKAVKSGIMQLEWKSYCLGCTGQIHQTPHLHGLLEKTYCSFCKADVESIADDNLMVVFSISEDLLETTYSEDLPPDTCKTNGLVASKLLHNRYFQVEFTNEVVKEDVGLKIKNMTILFTDLKGSTELYETYGDLDAFRLVRQHFIDIEKILHANHGVVVKTIGDAVMASFLVAQDGLKAAMEIQAWFINSVETRKIVLKMGLHSGSALVVNLNGRIDYFGGNINIAARVQSLSIGDDIFISNEILNDPRSRPLLKKLPTIYRYKAKLKGLKNEYQVYQLRHTKVS